MRVPATPVAEGSCSVIGSLIRIALTVVLIGGAFDANDTQILVWLVILVVVAAQAGCPVVQVAFGSGAGTPG